MKIIIRNKGGFGNQLFIYAFYLYLRDICPQHNIVIENFSGFFRNKIVYPHIQTNKPLLGSFFKIKRGNIIDTMLVYIAKFNIKYFKVLDIDFFDGDNSNFEELKFQKTTVIEGYFQNHQSYEAYLEKTKVVLNKSANKTKNLIKYQNIALQIRANDYKFKVNIDYINKALLNFGVTDNSTVHIFTDNIEWCKRNLDFIKMKKFIKTGNDIKDLFILTAFQKVILTIGTYGWWGAFLGDNNKKVIYPKNKTHKKDFYPKKWLRI